MKERTKSKYVGGHTVKSNFPQNSNMVSKARVSSLGDGAQALSRECDGGASRSCMCGCGRRSE